MARARTQRPRARTGVGQKRRATSVPFDQLEAAIDALGAEQDAEEPASAPAAPKRRAQTARPTKRRGPPRPPPGAKNRVGPPPAPAATKPAAPPARPPAKPARSSGADLRAPVPRAPAPYGSSRSQDPRPVRKLRMPTELPPLPDPPSDDDDDPKPTSPPLHPRGHVPLPAPVDDDDDEPDRPVPSHPVEDEDEEFEHPHLSLPRLPDVPLPGPPDDDDLPHARRARTPSHAPPPDPRVSPFSPAGRAPISTDLPALPHPPSDDDAIPAARAVSESSARVRRRLESDVSSPRVRAISVGDSIEEDLVVEVDDLPELRTLSIAILDEPPAVAAAKSAIAIAGHRVAGVGSGSIGIEQLKSLLRTGSAEALLVGVPGGEPLIDTALALAPRRPVVIAVCSASGIDAVREASSVGADLAIARPIEPERLAPILLAASRLVDERHSTTAARGSETLLRARLDALVEPELGTLQPFELFQRVLELELKRSRRYGYPIAVALFSTDVGSPEPPPGVRGILRARAGNALIHAIRDIDMATELDQERFLVLLPYTTLGGAAEVARRIVASVIKGDPVVAGGRTFPPRITGSVAGAIAGQPLSFSRLMRDATQALEQARRDGAELAVPMIRDPDDDA